LVHLTAQKFGRISYFVSVPSWIVFLAENEETIHENTRITVGITRADTNDTPIPMANEKWKMENGK